MASPRVAPELQPLHDAALALLETSHHAWAPRLRRALLSCRLRLKDGDGGFTIPFYWLGLRSIWIGRELAARGVTLRGLHVLLHETAHHCGAVLPEWKNWFGRWGGVFANHEIYGPGVNSADTLAAELLEAAQQASLKQEFS